MARITLGALTVIDVHGEWLDAAAELGRAFKDDTQ